MDIVFHLGALTSIPASIVDPVASDAVNIGGTLNMLIAARESRVKRFVFASTTSVYGDCLVPMDEDATVTSTDALLLLKKSVGENVALQCPA